MTLRNILLALSASYLLSVALAEYSVHQVPLIYFRADQFFPANRQYIHGDYYDPSGQNHLIQPPTDNGRDVQEGPLSVNEISQIKNIIRERQPVTTEDPSSLDPTTQDPSSQREGRNQDLSQNFNADIYTSGDESQNGFQDNAQPNFGDNSQFNFRDNAQPNFGENVQPLFQDNSQSNFPNNGQPGPNFQNNGQPGPNFQNNGQPGPNFQNNGQPGPNFQSNGQPDPNIQNNGQPGPNFQNNGQPGPNFQNNGQPGPNFQNNGQPGPNFQSNGQPDPNIQNNGQPGPNFQNNGQPGPNFQNNGQPGPNFQNNGQPGPNFQNNGQPGLNFQNNGQPGPNFQNNGPIGPNFPANAQFNFPQFNGQSGLNFLNNVQAGPIFTSNGHPGPNIVSPSENIGNHAVITEFPAIEVRSEPASPPSVTVSDVIHTSKVYQDNSYAPPTPEGNAVHVSHHVEHHETLHPANNPLVHPDTSYGAPPPNNALESLPDFPTPPTVSHPGSPVGPPHHHDNQAPHFSAPFPHHEHAHQHHHEQHAHHFDLASGPFSQNSNVHFAGHGPSDFSGNGFNAVYGPFDASSFDPNFLQQNLDANFLQQNPIILNNADTFFTQHLPTFPIFPHSNYEQNRFIFPQGFPQPSSLPLADSNFPDFPAYPPGSSLHEIASSTPSQQHLPSGPISQSPDSFTAQPPPSQQLTIPNASSF